MLEIIGDWLDAVIWDDQNIPSAALDNPLILDLNDKEMLLEENAPRIEEKPAPEPVAVVEKVRKGRRPKRNISEIESIIEEEMGEELDPFNYSLDRLYLNSNRVNNTRARPKSMGKPVVQHSIPALKLSTFKTHFTAEELRNFHRPRTKFPANKKIKIVPIPEQGSSRDRPRGSRKQTGAPRRKRELSGKDGRLIVTEYLEQMPPLIMNVGMGTKVLNYYRKKDTNDIPPENLREDGETFVLEQSDDCPFLGEVPTGDTVQMLDNNLFKAPLVKHDVPMTDFLLIRGKNNKAYIREIPAVYAVGQLQPSTEVPAPNSRASNNFIKSRLQTFIYRLFKKRANQQRLRISDICTAFPNHSETSIRKRLKDCADFQRGGDDSGWWTVKKNYELPSEDDLRSKLTPETVCAYESMLAGHQHLQDVGIEHITNPTGLAAAINQLELEQGGRLKEAAKGLKDEVSLAPWNLTSNFMAVQNGKGQLQLKGLGDPTNIGAGFSYIRVPSKVQHQQKAALPKTSVTGTDADLRKLSLKHARIVLSKFGVSEEVISKLSRWEMIDLVRTKSSAAAVSGEDPILTKFARGSRHSYQVQQQAYKDECARIFEKQLKFLSEKEPDDISDDEEAEDLLQDNAELQDLAGEMERELELLFEEEPEVETKKHKVKKEDERPTTVSIVAEANKAEPVSTPKVSRPTARSSASRFLANRKKSLLRQQQDDEEAERRELQKFIEEEREKKREEAIEAASGQLKASAASLNVKPEKNGDEVVSITCQDSIEGGEPLISKMDVDDTDETDAEKPKKQIRRVIKRTVTKKNPDGTSTKVVEIIRDPVKVEEYMKKNKAESAKRAKKPKLTAEEEAERLRMRKEKRRLQEQLRRLKKNEAKQRELKERMKEGNLDGSSVGGASAQLVCGACGMTGHMRTNRICPRYQEAPEVVKPPKRERPVEVEPAVQPGMVKVQGTKIRFSKMVLSKINPAGAASSAPSTPTPASSNGDDKRHRKTLSVEPPSPIPTPIPTPAPAPTPALSPSTPAHSVPATDTNGSRASEQEPKKLILRISKKDLPKNAMKGQKRKSSELSEPGYMQQPPPKQPRVRRKTGRGAGVELASLLEQVLLKVKSHEFSYAFLHPVSTKEAPEYYKIIKRPMDLGTIHRKVNSFEYLSSKQFVDDMKLMVQNCHKYCDSRHPHLPPIAETLLIICEDALKLIETEVAELEALINSHGPQLPAGRDNGHSSSTTTNNNNRSTPASSPLPSPSPRSPLSPSSSFSFSQSTPHPKPKREPKTSSSSSSSSSGQPSSASTSKAAGSSNRSSSSNSNTAHPRALTVKDKPSVVRIKIPINKQPTPSAAAAGGGAEENGLIRRSEAHVRRDIRKARDKQATRERD